MKCIICGYAVKQLTEDIFECSYCKHHFRNYKEFDYAMYSKNNYWWKDSLKIKREQFKIFKLIKKFLVKGNVLEIGAANGHILQAARLYLNSDIAYYNELVKLAIPTYKNFTEYIGSVEENIHKEYINVGNIIGVYVLEHIRNIWAVLMFIEETLKIGGTAIFLTDRFVDIDTSFYNELGHINIFSSKSLEILINGYNGLKIKYNNYDSKKKWLIVLERIEYVWY